MKKLLVTGFLLLQSHCFLSGARVRSMFCGVFCTVTVVAEQSGDMVIVEPCGSEPGSLARIEFTKNSMRRVGYPEIKLNKDARSFFQNSDSKFGCVLVNGDPYMSFRCAKIHMSVNIHDGNVGIYSKR